jgi:hypothetical protein
MNQCRNNGSDLPLIYKLKRNIYERIIYDLQKGNN